MDDKLRSNVELFIKNTQYLKSELPWQDANMRRLSAFLYSLRGLEANADAIREARDIIKRSTGVFSSFRGNIVLCVATLISLADDPEAMFANTLDVYKILKELKFRASDYLAIAAYQIASETTLENYRKAAERARAFYDGAKQTHWMLTSQDDYIYTSMLGLSDLDVNFATNRMEQLYVALKPEFTWGNSVQSLTQVLVLGDDTSGTIARLVALKKSFRDRGMKLDKEYTLSSLGILAMLPVDDRQLVDDVAEVAEFLRTQKGFGVLSLSKQEILLLAASLVSNRYIDDVKNGLLTTTLSTSLTNILLAQQAACIAGTAAVVAASTSSSSSS